MSSSSRSTEALWQAFFANPLDWWDNRKDKVTSPSLFLLGHLEFQMH